MAKLVFLLIFGFIPYILCQCTVEEAEPQFKISVYEFSMDLLTRLAQDKDTHFMSSPLLIWSLLSSISLGAADTTLAEIRQVLNLPRHECFNEYLELVNSIAVNNETDVVVEKSSAIFTDDKKPILESFKRKIKSATDTRFESLPFDNTDVAAQRINDYVSQATHEIINEIVAPSDLEDITLIILDAIFFKGTWKIPFPHELTLVEPFYNESKEQIGQVNMMYLSAPLNYRYVPKLSASVVEIPYGSGARYSMYAFLPDKDVSVSTVIDKLKVESLKTIQYLFDGISPRELNIKLPRFKITSELNNLKGLLEDMGLKTMFDSNRAQFPNLSDYHFHVCNFIQKANIEVTEEGTVAAAVTEIEFSSRIGSDEINFNKPFLFMIIDKKIEVPLFVGAYSKPRTF